MKTKQLLIYLFFLFCLHNSYGQLSGRNFLLNVSTDFHQGSERFYDRSSWDEKVKNRGVGINIGLPLFKGRLWTSASFESMNLANPLLFKRAVPFQFEGRLKYYFLGWDNPLKFFIGVGSGRHGQKSDNYGRPKSIQYFAGGDYFFDNAVFLNTVFFYQQRNQFDNHFSGYGLNASLQHYFERKKQERSTPKEYYQGAYILNVDSLGFHLGDLNNDSQSERLRMTLFIDARLDYMLLDQLSIGAHLNFRYLEVNDDPIDRSIRMSLGEYVRYIGNTFYDNCKVYGEVGLEILRSGNKVYSQSKQTFQVTYSSAVGFDLFLNPAVILDFQTGYRWGKREEFFRLRQQEFNFKVNRIFFQSRMKYLF